MTSFTSDIHFPLLGAAATAAQTASSFLSTLMKNEIDLTHASMPHVTLYLTEWQCSRAPGPDPSQCKEQLDTALSEALYALKIESCRLTISAPYAAGNYAMLNVSRCSCVQRYSDTIVNATYTLAVANQTVPSWVYTLPEPERSEKIEDVKKYGSPNVFSQFQPHVTIGWAANASAVAAAVKALAAKFAPFSYSADVVALGVSGAHGTVVRGADLAIFNLTAPNDPCANAYKAEAPCDADNVTSGGCVWCDIVDRPAFCTTTTLARQLPRFPPHMCNFRGLALGSA